MSCELTDHALAYAVRRIKRHRTSDDRSGFLIGFEALDGVGKTTTVRAVAEKLGGIALSSPINDISRRTRANIDNAAFADPLQRFYFYRDTNRVDTQEHLLPTLNRGQNVFLDRFSLSTIVGNSALGLDLNLCPDVVNDSNYDLDVAVPDRTLWLKISENERMCRLQSRRAMIGDKPDSNMDFNCCVQARMEELYAQLVNFGLIEVDITGLNVEEVRDKVIDVLAQNGIFFHA